VGGCEVSGVRRSVGQILTALGCYAAYGDGYLSPFNCLKPQTTEDPHGLNMFENGMLGRKYETQRGEVTKLWRKRNG